MKKVLLFLLVAILVLSMFAGCGKGASNDTPTFMFCISHMTNAWAKEASESMTAAATAAGAEMIVNEAGSEKVSR